MMEWDGPNYEPIEVAAKKEAKKWTLIVAIITVPLFALLVANMPKNNPVIEGILLVSVALLFALILIIEYIFLKKCAIMEKEYARNEMYTKEILSTEEYLEVFPKEETDMVSDLKKRAKFYAILKEDGVHIMLKYNGEDKYVGYDVIEAGYFLDDYADEEN